MVTILPVYISTSTPKKYLSLSISVKYYISLLYCIHRSERKTDFRLDYWYFHFPKMYVINNFTFTFNLVLISIAYSFLKTFLSLEITSLIIYSLVINSTFTFNIVYTSRSVLFTFSSKHIQLSQKAGYVYNVL